MATSPTASRAPRSMARHSVTFAHSGDFGPRHLGCPCGRGPSHASLVHDKSSSAGRMSARLTSLGLAPRHCNFRQCLMAREMQLSNLLSTSALRQRTAEMIGTCYSEASVQCFPRRVYTGQFSSDGQVFYTACQDMTIHLFDAKDPLKLKHNKMIYALHGNWTITDVGLSPDKQHLIYSSLSPFAHYVNLNSEDPSENQVTLNFSDRMTRPFSIWALRLSGDGREVIAGTGNNSICVYDINTQKVLLRQVGHSDDVNSVCYADEYASHVIYSGSDDSLINVWDRRIMCNGQGRSAGVLVGHTEGITHVSSKGDGRYCLSNGKDQTMKLWDIRMMMSQSELQDLPRVDYRCDWDYRFMTYPGSSFKQHPQDRSIQTFRGHSVLRTLIRCYFSPAFSTNQQYVYTGSEDGRVYIYNLDGSERSRLDVHRTLTGLSNKSQRLQHLFNMHTDATVVRDVSWHPSLPIIASTTWSGPNGQEGSVTMQKFLPSDRMDSSNGKEDNQNDSVRFMDVNNGYADNNEDDDGDGDYYYGFTSYQITDSDENEDEDDGEFDEDDDDLDEDYDEDLDEDYDLDAELDTVFESNDQM
ncbi:WD40-repeat-containing domain protein [Syncephalis fuscata]|nr:WD40-repeat-containing domain protein [Syncephalis fuscata]